MLSRRYQETRKQKIQRAQNVKQAVEDRSKTIYKKRLCYGCLEGISKEHNAKSCSNRRQCKVCNGQHATILHGIKTEKQNQRNAPTK